MTNMGSGVEAEEERDDGSRHRSLGQMGIT